MLDLIVAGGGPVGLGAALYAARAGLEVVVIEPRAGVIDKACGEGLMPGALAALIDLGVDPAGQALRGIRYQAGAKQAAATFRQGPGRGVRRTTLHAGLRAAVADAGIAIEEGAVADVWQDEDRVLAGGVEARYMIAADGLHSPIRRRLGLEARPRTPRRFGLRCHAHVAPWTDFVEVHWSPDAEAYVTPVADDLVGVALLTVAGRPFTSQLSAFPVLAERLQGAELTRVRGAGPLRQRSTRRVAGRVLLAGDASGYVDALTGEGISVGLAQARAAVAAIARRRPHEYESAWRTITWRYRLLTSTLLQLTRVPPVRAALVPAATMLPRVFTAAVNELARPA